MKRTLSALLGVVALLAPVAAHADDADDADASPPHRYWVGTSMFMLMNLVPFDQPPRFFQLNAGYILTKRDRLSLEAMTWRYYHPLGIPWGSSYDSPDEAYPGHIREYGVGPAYQRFLWKGLYTSLSAVPFYRQYYDTDGRRIGNGFQLFLTFRIGYQLRLFDRVFVEPSIAATYWPVSTNVPAAFAARDAKWPSYFLWEPGLHVGIEL